MHRRLLLVLAIVLGTTSCMNAKVQADIMSEIQLAADELNAQRQDMAIMREEVDSLKTVIARQDTVLRKLMNLSGIPAGE
jgi:peptidoglycan hydrolase CwlO-like protein